jgi:histone H1/5
MKVGLEINSEDYMAKKLTSPIPAETKAEETKTVSEAVAPKAPEVAPKVEDKPADKKPEAKKPEAKKPAAKKPVAKKSAAKKPAAKKTTTSKAEKKAAATKAEKPAVKKAPAKKAATKAEKKATTPKAAAKTADKPAVKKASEKKAATTKKPAAPKAAAKSAEKPAVKKPAAKKAATQKTAAKKPVTKKASPKAETAKKERKSKNTMSYNAVVAIAQNALNGIKVSSKISKIPVNVILHGAAEGTFYILIEDGKVDVQPYRYEDSAADFKISADNFIALVNGKFEISVGMSNRTLEITGDYKKAMIACFALFSNK